MSDLEHGDSFEKRRGEAYDGSMEPRVNKLEQDVAQITADVAVLKTDVAVLKSDVADLKTDVAVIKANYVTKGELHAALHAMSWRIFGSMGVLCAAVFWIARNVEPPSKAPPPPPTPAIAQAPRLP